MLPDGTLGECDRLGDGRADCATNTGATAWTRGSSPIPMAGLLWISQTLPGRAQELTAARTHRLIRICERQDVPIVADRAYTGVDSWAAARSTANCHRPNER